MWRAVWNEERGLCCESRRSAVPAVSLPSFGAFLAVYTMQYCSFPIGVPFFSLPLPSSFNTLQEMSGSPMEGIVKRLRALTQYLSQECGGGPKPFKHSMVINFQKGGTLPLCLVLMTFFKNFSPTAWMYTALHGSYGLLWVMKDR